MSRRHSVIHAVIDGYDLAAELTRYAFRDVDVGGVCVNRGTAEIRVDSSPDDAFAARCRASHDAHMFMVGHHDRAPVVELGYPVAGHFHVARNGVYFDATLGGAQRLLDDHHPNLLTAVEHLREHGLLLRREAAAEDFLAPREGAQGIVTPDVAADAICGMVRQAFPTPHGYRAFFASSGAEAVEAAIKLAQRVRFQALVATNGRATVERLMGQLGIEPVTGFGDDDPDQPLYDDYPMFVISCHGACHGRTMGAMTISSSRRVRHVGLSRSRWSRQIPFNGPGDALDRLLDRRPLGEVLNADGGVRAVLDAGRVPVELVALFCAEGMQGDGGYLLARREFLRSVRDTCTHTGILYLADEVQTFARTGMPFMHQHIDVAPDLVAIAKAAMVGVMIARADLGEHLQQGWHASTWAAGRILDLTMAHTVIATLADYRDPVFLGRSYFENQRIKGEYIRRHLAELAERHSGMLLEFNGLGCMFGLTVTRRDEFIARAWQRGIKLMRAGADGEESRVRLLFLADVLTREIDAIMAGLDGLLTELDR